MKVWMTLRRGILGRKPTLFPNPRTGSADMEHNSHCYRFHTDFLTVLFNGTWNRLELLLLLAAASLFVSFALEFQSRSFSRQLFSGFLLGVLQTEGKRRTIYRSKRGWRAKQDSFPGLTERLCKNWRS